MIKLNIKNNYQIRCYIFHPHWILMDEGQTWCVELWTSLQNMADSTDAVGWSPILPSVKSVGVGRQRGKESATLVGRDPLD